MNRKLSIPMMNNMLNRAGIEKNVKILKELNVDYAVLAIDQLLYNKEERKKTFESLKNNINYLKNEGFKVGVWRWTLFFQDENPFTKVSDYNGKENPSFACPADPEFLKFIAEYDTEIAKLGPDFILLDDDYRFGYLTGRVGCFCGHHLKTTCDKLGENLTSEELAEKALKGKPNKYRKAWLEAKGESLENYARTMRKAVDAVNPNIRIGLCACMPTWIGDGTDCIKISKLLAGSTKPFMRFIGAPYWTVNFGYGGHRLQDVIELERMQSSWCENQGIETLTEGDCFPRPRHTCPASYLELFDIALIADGKTDGIHKYMLDYYGSVDYEKGYIQYHIDNKQLREDIYNIFNRKKAVGVRVFESLDKLDNAELSENIIEDYYVQNMFFSLGSTTLTASSIPTHYDDTDDTTLIFGESIKAYPYKEKKAPLILDTFAANYLQKQGVDVGLLGVFDSFSRDGSNISATFEFYDPQINEYSSCNNLNRKRIEIKDSCKTILYYNIDSQKETAAYTYTNNEGQSFLVLAFDSRYSNKDGVRNYLLQNALIRGIEEISGKLPVVCPKNPDLYIIAKQKDNKLSVGLFNFFADKLLYKDVTLAKEIEDVKFINCEGSFEGKVVKIKELKPFDAAAFEVTFKD